MDDFPRYVPAAVRRRKAERETERLLRKGVALSPVIVEGRRIAQTFWGESWCKNLERYSDFSNRLPRGRSYLRNGSLIDLQIAAGSVAAAVMGSRLYRVRIEVTALTKARWEGLCRDCAGGIDSLVELLQGHLSRAVMERICRERTGLFPAPEEIGFDCTCPDRASMCKHVAATLYGVGARLDREPHLLFTLRRVDHNALIASAGQGIPPGAKGPAKGKLLTEGRLSEIFGIDIAGGDQETRPEKKASAPPRRRARNS